MIFHVILGGMRQDNARHDSPDHRTNTAEQTIVVKDFQVIANRRMPRGANQFRGGARFASSNCRNARGAMSHAAEIATGNIEAMDFPSVLAEQKECPGHEELDVIRVRGDGEDGWHVPGGHSEEFQNAGVIFGAGMTSPKLSSRAQFRSGKAAVRNVVEGPR